jgi:predicted DNA binding CopG/RHH family protein
MTKGTIPPIVEAWDDESLGADLESMKVVDRTTAEALDDAAGTQAISIRMSKSMVDAFKTIAAANKGIGYQTLMKQILQRFIESEMKRVWNEHLDELAQGARRSSAKLPNSPLLSIAKRPAAAGFLFLGLVTSLVTSA